MIAFSGIILVNQASSRVVIVTSVMEHLLSVLTNPNFPHKMHALLGPKGTGKSTTLYWIYRQLKVRSLTAVPILARELINDNYLEIIKVSHFQLHSCRTRQHLLSKTK